MGGDRMTKFVLLTTQRSGSTFIRLWLNNHPSVQCYGEVFLRDYPAVDGFKYYCEANIFRRTLYYILCKPYLTKSPYNFVSKKLIREFLNGLYYVPCFTEPWTDISKWKNYQPRRYNNIERAVGFQLMYNQLRDYEYLYEWIISNEVSIVHLTRKNLLKLYLSRLIARQSGIYHSFVKSESARPVQKIFVDQKNILPRMKDILKQREEVSNIFSENPSVEFSYEDFFSNYTDVSQKIFSFLGLEDVVLELPNLEKINPNSIEQIIENYKEIAETLKGTPFEEFLA
jgi:LPS sulfotransferase NodH